MAVADTSALVPLFDADHVHHGRARRALTGHARLLVPTVALAELTTYLRRAAQDVGLDGNQVARQAVQELLALPGVEERQAYDGAAGHRLYLAPGKLSFSDAVVIATALRYGDELVTFDAHMARRWKAGPG